MHTQTNFNQVSIILMHFFTKKKTRVTNPETALARETPGAWTNRLGHFIETFVYSSPREKCEMISRPLSAPSTAAVNEKHQNQYSLTAKLV